MHLYSQLRRRITRAQEFETAVSYDRATAIQQEKKEKKIVSGCATTSYLLACDWDTPFTLPGSVSSLIK